MPVREAKEPSAIRSSQRALDGQRTRDCERLAFRPVEQGHRRSNGLLRLRRDARARAVVGVVRGASSHCPTGHADRNERDQHRVRGRPEP